MQGGAIERCRVTGAGLNGDRRWAVRDEQRREIQWAKVHPQLLLCAARYLSEPDEGEPATVEIAFPDGESLRSDDDRVHAKLSELLGREATLRPLEPPENVEFYKRHKPDEQQFMKEVQGWFAREPGEPMPEMSEFPEVLMDHVSVPGTFFDNEEIHLITTASLVHMRASNPDADWDVRRFRPNFQVETEPGLEGLIENDWLGRRLRIGPAELEITAPTPRCNMVMRPQLDLPFDRTILRTVVREGNQCLGVGAHVRVAGAIQQGDAVELI